MRQVGRGGPGRFGHFLLVRAALVNQVRLSVELANCLTSLSAQLFQLLTA